MDSTEESSRRGRTSWFVEDILRIFLFFFLIRRISKFSDRLRQNERSRLQESASGEGF